MSSKDRMDFILRLTDWFHGHWEDPEWGKRPTTQILVALAVRELANVIQDKVLREQIQGGADKVIVSSSRG